MRDRVLSARASAAFLLSLTSEEALVLADEPDKVRAFLAERARWIAENTFVIPLSDEEAVELLVQWKGYTKELAWAKVMAWRAYAQKSGYNGPIVFQVKAGFTTELAPEVGKCSRSLQELTKEFDCKHNTPTEDSLVFWVPMMAWGTVCKPTADAKQMSWQGYKRMVEIREGLRKMHGLPKDHCDRFGSIALLIALILAHLKRTGDRVPKSGEAMSDTTATEKLPRNHWDTTTPRISGHVILGDHSRDSGLDCDVSNGFGCVGFFLLGVEKLGSPVAPTAK